MVDYWQHITFIGRIRRELTDIYKYEYIYKKLLQRQMQIPLPNSGANVCLLATHHFHRQDTEGIDGQRFENKYGTQTCERIEVR